MLLYYEVEVIDTCTNMMLLLTKVCCHGDRHNETGPWVEEKAEKDDRQNDVEYNREDVEQHLTARRK